MLAGSIALVDHDNSVEKFVKLGIFLSMLGSYLENIMWNICWSMHESNQSQMPMASPGPAHTTSHPMIQD